MSQMKQFAHLSIAVLLISIGACDKQAKKVNATKGAQKTQDIASGQAKLSLL